MTSPTDELKITSPPTQVWGRSPLTPSSSPKCTIYRKIAIVGGRGVGKSSITQYCIFGEQSKLKEPNPAVEYSHHICVTLARYPKATINCSLVDTPGYFGRQGTVSKVLSRNVSIGVDAYILVFSIKSRESFEQIKEINRALFDMLGDPPNIPRVLVGNMADKRHERTVSRAAAEALAAEWGVRYIETSGVTGESVGEVFDQVFIEIEADNPFKWQYRNITGDCCDGTHWFNHCTIS